MVPDSLLRSTGQHRSHLGTWRSLQEGYRETTHCPVGEILDGQTAQQRGIKVILVQAPGSRHIEETAKLVTFYLI